MMYHGYKEPIKARDNIILALLGLIVVMFVGFVWLGVGKYDLMMEMQSEGRQDILEQIKTDCTKVYGAGLLVNTQTGWFCEGEFTDY